MAYNSALDGSDSGSDSNFNSGLSSVSVSGLIFGSSSDSLAFISGFDVECMNAVRTLQKREYVVSVPVTFSLFNFETDVSSCGLTDIAIKYSEEYIRALDLRINKANLKEAITAYLISEPSEDELINSFRARLNSFLHPTGIALTVSGNGTVFVEVERYDDTELIEYAARELAGIYENRFLTDAIGHDELDSDLSAIILDYALRLDEKNDEEAQSAGEQVQIDVRRSTYKLNIGSAASDVEAIKAFILSDTVSSLEEYNHAVTELKVQTAALPVHTPIPEPDSGVLTGTSSGLRLSIENTAGFGSRYIEFIPVTTGSSAPTSADSTSADSISASNLFSSDDESILSVYIREGEVHAVRLPAGSYIYKSASGAGSAWFGEENLFGAMGRYTMSAAAITLESGRYTLALNTSDTAGRLISEIVAQESAQADAVGVSTRLYNAETLKIRQAKKIDGKLPYLIYVSKNSFTIAILGLDDSGEYTKLLHTFHTAVGRTNGQTRAGTYTIISRERWHRWSSGNYSPYATRHSGGLWFHGPTAGGRNSYSMSSKSYNEIGSKATSGCMRTYTSVAAWIYDNCANGTTVIIANDSKYTSSPREKIETSQRFDPTDPTISVEIR